MLLTWVTAAAICAAAAPIGYGAAEPLTRTERSFLLAINDVRIARSLPAVVVVSELGRSAKVHSSDMVARHYFSHQGFPRRLRAFGARGPILGEDLGWSVDDGAAIQRIVAMWLASPTHRRILLRPGFRKLGIGVSRGPFGGWAHAVVVTADFEGT